jgi:hypothetical protein
MWTTVWRGKNGGCSLVARIQREITRFPIQHYICIILPKFIKIYIAEKHRFIVVVTQVVGAKILIPKRPKAIFRPFLKFGQAIMKAIFIKHSWIKLWIGGLVLASRRTNFYKIPIFGLVLMSQNVFFFSIWVAKKLFIIKFF